MTTLGYVAAAVAGAFTLLVIYGFSHDLGRWFEPRVERWLDRRQWRRDREAHIEKCCAPYAGMLVYTPFEAEQIEFERLSSGVAVVEAMFLQRDEIRNLPQTP